jgi:hypothetical protein
MVLDDDIAHGEDTRLRRIRRALAKRDSVPQFHIDIAQITPAMRSAVGDYKRGGSQAADAAALMACFDHAFVVKASGFAVLSYGTRRHWNGGGAAR